MSLFNVNYRNEIDIRSNEAFSEKLFTVNPLNGLMERVLPGGGGGGGGDTPYTPPYWVQPQSANIYDNGSRDATTHTKLGFTVENIADDKKSSLTKDGIEVDNNATGTGSLLTASTLTFGDSIDNASFTKVGAKNLAEIGARITKITPTATDKMLIYDTAASAYRTTDWRDYLKPTTVEFSDAFTTNTVSATGSMIASHYSGDTLAEYRKTSMKIGNKVGTTTTIDGGKARVIATASGFYSISGTTGTSAVLKFEGVEIHKDGLMKTLTLDNLSDLVALYAKTSSASPESGDNILLFDPETKTYKHTPIPTGVSVPAYIKPSSIEMTNAIGNKVRVNTGVTPLEYVELNTLGLSLRNGQNNEVTMNHSMLSDLVKFKNRTALANPWDDNNKVITYNSTNSTFGVSNRNISRVLRWVPVLSGNQAGLYDNNGLVDGTKLKFSNRTLTSTTPYVAGVSAFPCPVIGSELFSLHEGDTLHFDFPNVVEGYGFTLTTSNRIAVLPFKIVDGSYDPLVSFPMFTPLYDVNHDVNVTVEPGTYEYKGPMGTNTVNCNLLIFTYTGTTTRAVIPDVALKYQLNTLQTGVIVGNVFE